MANAKYFLDMGPLKNYPEFRRLWIGMCISATGTQIAIVAVQIQVFLITKSSLDVGLVALVQLAPAIVGAILGGSIADSMDRRKMLMITQLSLAACALLFALNATSGHPKLWLIFVLAAVNAGVSACDSPARAAALTSIVDRESLVAASTLRQLFQQVAMIIGPSIGGILIGSFGVASAYWVNLVSFSASFAAIVSISASPPRGGTTKFGLSSVLEGFRFTRTSQVIKACFVADLNATILGMPTALFPALGLQHFHGGSQTVGLLYAAPGFGAFIAATFSGWTGKVRFQGRAVLYSIVLWGIAIAGFGLTDLLFVGLVLLAIAGGADVISAIFRSAMLQAETPDRLRGRLSALQTAVVQSGPRLGNFEAGAAASLIGLQLSVITGGIGCVLGIALIAKRMPRFAHYEMMAEVPAYPTEPTGGGKGSDQPATG